MYMHMRSIASVLALGLGCAQASHMTWACNDAEAFGDVGCVITHPAGPSFPGVVGVLGYGAAGTAEATRGGATDPGEGTLACIVVKHGPNANFPIPPVIAVRPFVTCSDLDKFPASEWVNGGVRGLVGGASTSGTLTGQNATGETPGNACRRIAADALAHSTSTPVLGFDTSTGAPTGSPWVTTTCPRLGGYKGHGGTAIGYQSFLDKEIGVRGLKCASWCNRYTVR